MIGFTDRITVIQRKRSFVEFFEELMHPGAVNEILRTLLEILAGIIFNRVYLREHIEHIETETVHTLVQPEVQDGDDLFPDFGILPV